GGAGMLAALGAEPVDAAGHALPPGGAALRAVAGLRGASKLPQVTLVAATDVDNPLLGPHGASAVFGQQQGATAADVALLGAALLALGGHCESGIALVRDLTGLDAALDSADLVITGEGSFDSQSLRGKVVAGVAAAARERGLPCLVVAGRVAVAPSEARAAGVSGAWSLVDHFGGDVEQAMTRPAAGLRELGARLAARWAGA